MADKKICNELLSPGKWYQRPCCNKAKFLCEIEKTNGVQHTKTYEYRCGIHAKRYEKLEKL